MVEDLDQPFGLRFLSMSFPLSRSKRGSTFTKGSGGSEYLGDSECLGDSDDSDDSEWASDVALMKDMSFLDEHRDAVVTLFGEYFDRTGDDGGRGACEEIDGTADVG